MPLLPSGLQDILPPYAARERAIMGALLERFSLFGYAQAAPPLAEFDTTLLSGKGEAQAHNTFRFIDPASQAMMGLRADITPQIERIAIALLKEGKDIVRLSYAGQVLRIAPSSLSPMRQLRQAGIEMIGEVQHIQELEIITAAIESLQKLELRTLVLSLSHTELFEKLFAGCLPDSKQVIRKAIYHKDRDSLPLSTPFRDITIALMHESIDELLERSDLPATIRSTLDYLQQLTLQLHERFPDLTIHIDPLDTEGFDYHEGTCFTLYDSESRQEIGRGGCYTLTDQIRGCGITLYIERLLLSTIAQEPPPSQQMIYKHTPYMQAKELRDQGVVTVLMP